MNINQMISTAYDINFMIKKFGVIFPFRKPSTLGSLFYPFRFTTGSFIKLVLNITLVKRFLQSVDFQEESRYFIVEI